MDKERALALQTAENFQNWRDREQKDCLDFSKMALARKDFRKFNFAGVDFSGTGLQDTNLEGADLTGAKLVGASLERADLSDAILINADCRGAKLISAKLPGANFACANLATADLSGALLTGAQWHNTKMTHTSFAGVELGSVDFSGYDLSQANFSGANLSGANFRGAKLNATNFHSAILNHAIFDRAQLNDALLQSANLAYASLVSTSLRGANLQSSSLKCADFTHTDFYETHVLGADFEHARGLFHSRNLHTARLDSGDVRYFESVEIPAIEKWISWEKIRVVGRLPLFAVSYSALLAIPFLYYILSIYNGKVDIVRAWAAEELKSDSAIAAGAKVILAHLHREPIPALSLELLISTFVLGMGATIFTLKCPSRIREFSSDQWQHELRHSLIHYWPLSWWNRWWRLACVLLYATGGVGAAVVLGSKLLNVFWFILENRS